jgi:hypothetical protein
MRQPHFVSDLCRADAGDEAQTDGAAMCGQWKLLENIGSSFGRNHKFGEGVEL